MNNFRLTHNVVKDSPGIIEISQNGPAAGQMPISKGKTGHLVVVISLQCITMYQYRPSKMIVSKYSL